MAEELKQKAEESAKQNCPMPINWNEIDVAKRAGYIEGYIISAKENGIQWHKVADGDLPEDTSVKRVFVGNNEYYRLYYSHGRWVYCDKGGFRFFGDVIAWCEEPLFKE